MQAGWGSTGGGEGGREDMVVKQELKGAAGLKGGERGSHSDTTVQVTMWMKVCIFIAG